MYLDKNDYFVCGMRACVAFFGVVKNKKIGARPLPVEKIKNKNKK